MFKKKELIFRNINSLHNLKMCTQMDLLQMLLETVLTIFLMDGIEGRTLPTSSANPTPRHPHMPVIYIFKKTEWSRILRD